MAIRVLIVDDSRFLCKKMQEILEEESEFKVIGVAYNGAQGVELAAKFQPDVIIMDVEMPVMDGITAVKQIMASRPCPILMFSAMTQVGAKATLDALNAGAIDFLPKQLEEIDVNRETAKSLLRLRVRMVAQHTQRIASLPSLTKLDIEARSTLNLRNRGAQKASAGKLRKIDLLVIAASTGGPVAMQRILSQMPANCKIPVLLLLHMPKSFTKSFAERLNQLCAISVKEAEDGDLLRSGVALLSPGGMQMEIKSIAAQQRIALRNKQAGEIYSPCIDITFTSLAEVFSGQVLAVVLTGMGSDGKEGALKLKQHGAEIWAQDEASSTIYGMPRAIVEANLADQIYSLDEIATAITKLI